MSFSSPKVRAFFEEDAAAAMTGGGSSRVELMVDDLAVKKIWSDQDLSEFSKVNLIGQI